MPRGYTPRVELSREDTPLDTVFARSATITRRDVEDLEDGGITTAGQIAKSMSDRDLTNDVPNMRPEQALRIQTAFEKTPYRDLLDYDPNVAEEVTPQPHPRVEPPPTPEPREQNHLLNSAKEFAHGFTFNLFRR